MVLEAVLEELVEPEECLDMGVSFDFKDLKKLEGLGGGVEGMEGMEETFC